MIGSEETAPGVIVQDDKDRLLVGAFDHPKITRAWGTYRAQEFVKIYGAGQKTDVKYSENVAHDRWRKLVYNACLNPICAITGLDTGRIRLADGAVEGLVRPAMREIVEAAKANGVELADDVVETMIEVDALELYLSPSMLADVRKVRTFSRCISHLFDVCGSNPSCRRKLMALLVYSMDADKISGELYRV